MLVARLSEALDRLPLHEVSRAPLRFGQSTSLPSARGQQRDMTQAAEFIEGLHADDVIADNAYDALDIL